MFDALYTPRTPLEAETKQLVVPPGTEANKGTHSQKETKRLLFLACTQNPTHI